MLQQLVASNPENENYIIRVAMFYRSKGQVDKAEGVLLEGKQNHPDNFEIRFALSRFYMEQQRVDEAIAELKACLTIDEDVADPGIIESKNLLANALYTQGDLISAEKYTEEVLAAVPSVTHSSVPVLPSLALKTTWVAPKRVK